MTIDWQDKNVLISVTAVVLVVVLLFVWSSFIKPPAENNEVSLNNSIIQNDTPQYVQNEIIVKFTNKSEPEIVKVSVGQVDAEVERYSQMETVSYVQPNYLAYIMQTSNESFPNDPVYKDQWNLHDSQEGGINIEPAWDLTMKSIYKDNARDTQVIVAVVDTGVAYEEYVDYEGMVKNPIANESSLKLVRRYNKSPDLEQACIVPGYDFVHDDAHPNDDHGHGTAIAGVIAQNTNNELGTAGIAFGACIMPIKVMDAMGSGDLFRVSAGIRWAADHGANIINIGFGVPVDAKILRDAIFYAWSHGITIVAPVGNSRSSDTLIYPAAYDPFVIGVGATNSDRKIAEYSNYSSIVDLVAPGGSIKGKAIWSSSFVAGININKRFVDSDTQWQSFKPLPFAGTSFAAAHVSGVIALLMSGERNLDPVFVETLLSATADDLGELGWDKKYGWGIIDVEAAVELLFYPSIGNPSPIPPNPSDVTLSDFWSGSWSTAVYTFEDGAWVPRPGIDEYRFPLFDRPDFKNDPQPMGMRIDWQSRCFCGVMDGYYDLKAPGSF